MLLERYGILLGILLLAVVSACALLLGRKAAQSVARFREEHHERFTGNSKP
jgi:hypothetical protein